MRGQPGNCGAAPSRAEQACDHKKSEGRVELEFSTDQEELRDSIRAVLAKESPVSLAREVVETGRAPDALWATMTALGWPALTVPEEYGGIGLGPIEAGILAEELGRVIAPGPLLATVTQYVPVVRETATPEQQARFLGAVAWRGAWRALPRGVERKLRPGRCRRHRDARRRRVRARGHEALRDRSRRGRRARGRRAARGDHRRRRAHGRRGAGQRR